MHCWASQQWHAIHPVRRLGSAPNRPLAALAILAVCLLWSPLGSLTATAQAAPDGNAPATKSKPAFVAASVGLGNVYKLGCWTPVEVVLRGGKVSETGFVTITVTDTDGVPTTVRTSPSRPVRVDPGQTTPVRLFIRPGQTNSPVSAQFVVDGKGRAKRKFYVSYEPDEESIAGGLPATNQLLLCFGSSLDLAELLHPWQRNPDLLQTKIAHVDQAAQLPTEWYGYEGFDTVVLTTSDAELYRPLQQDSRRLIALQQWVERGGRLVVFCGEEAPELLADGGPLAELVPGRYERQVPLRQAHPLEVFSGSSKSLPGGRLDLRVPQLVDVRGEVLAFAGSKATDLPLLVRAPQGLGELIFAAVDIDRPPFRDWAGRTSLLRKLFDWSDDDTPPNLNSSQAIGSDRPADLAAHLRNALDQQFADIQAVPFALVALLVILYIALIGPGDFFLVKKVLKRMELTWITFPLIVIGTSVGAYYLAYAMKGDQLRVNQVEIVDVDVSSGLARGTVWTHFFSPRVDTYDLTLTPRLPGETEAGDTDRLVGWLGLPGYGLGGMQTYNSQGSMLDRGYQFGEHLESIHQLPVQVWSTKTLTARWTATTKPGIDFQLAEAGDQLLEGQITSHLGEDLTDCLLLHGRWAYKIARLTNGATVVVDDRLAPRTVKTLLSGSTAGDETATQLTDDGTVRFNQFSTDVARITKAMMFHEAIGGTQYTSEWNRYQHFVDMSHKIQSGQAVLLGRSQNTGSTWQNDGRPLRSDKDKQWLYYRFVIPVEALGAGR